MSRAPTGGDSDSDEDMDKEYQIELLYHAADAADGEVQAERLRVDAKSTWPDVKKFAQQRSGHADFALEDEDGGRLGAQTPLAWIRADQQGRPYRRAVVKRRGVDADGVFERRGVCASTWAWWRNDPRRHGHHHPSQRVHRELGAARRDARQDFH